MTETSVRWRRWQRFGAASAALIVLAGCSNSSQHANQANHAGRSASPSTSAVEDPAGRAATARAIAAMKAVRSYRFTAVQRLTGPQTQTTVLTGTAIRPASISYSITVGASVQQVIKIGRTTFVRVPPARWKALAKPTPLADPLASLLPVLEALQKPILSGRVLTGEVSAEALSQARLAPAGAHAGAVTPVRLTLDPAGRVTSVALRLTVKAGSRTVVVDESTQFGAFGHVRPIKAPGIIKR